MNQDGIWLSILEYANAKKISISTIRRSIKAGHVKFKEENGKYFVWTTKRIETNSSELIYKEENENLKKEIRKIQEELSDLKALLVAYEYQHKNSFESLPHLPEVEL
jgi:uncharacterized protein (DUF342 family)